jgi:hypothetical protein
VRPKPDETISTAGLWLSNATVTLVWVVLQSVLGNVASVTLGPDGSVWALHRGGRVWDENSFDAENRFTGKDPIQVDVVVQMHPATGNSNSTCLLQSTWSVIASMKGPLVVEDLLTFGLVVGQDRGYGCVMGAVVAGRLSLISNQLLSFACSLQAVQQLMLCMGVCVVHCALCCWVAGQVLRTWGSGRFFMPHMITVDRDNNVWVTDVALQQALKFTAAGQLLMVVGKSRQPGHSLAHLCKPTQVGNQVLVMFVCQAQQPLFIRLRLGTQLL